MAEPEDMIMPMLREMRKEMRDGFGAVDKRFDAVNERLDGIEEGQRNLRHALSADTMMSKLVTGDFEERIAELERQAEEILKA